MTLKEKIEEEGALEQPLAVDIAIQVAEGLTYNDVLFDREQETPHSLTADSLRKGKVRIALADLSPRSQKIR